MGHYIISTSKGVRLRQGGARLAAHSAPRSPSTRNSASLRRHSCSGAVTPVGRLRRHQQDGGGQCRRPRERPQWRRRDRSDRARRSHTRHRLTAHNGSESCSACGMHVPREHEPAFEPVDHFRRLWVPHLARSRPVRDPLQHPRRSADGSRESPARPGSVTSPSLPQSGAVYSPRPSFHRGTSRAAALPRRGRTPDAPHPA